ncbi:MAG: ATP F0F1 synthase subunit C [Lachnospiraceae bacterium]|nr:ATP F0F1 synthase subunit C [Lachnospiraceae bacterium]
MGTTAIGAAICALSCMAAGLSIGNATGKATDAVARQPEADGKVMRILVLGCALAEATAIYGFVLGILIIFFLG